MGAQAGIFREITNIGASSFSSPAGSAAPCADLRSAAAGVSRQPVECARTEGTNDPQWSRSFPWTQVTSRGLLQLVQVDRTWTQQSESVCRGPRRWLLTGRINAQTGVAVEEQGFLRQCWLPAKPAGGDQCNTV